MKLIKSFVLLSAFTFAFAVDYRLETSIVPNTYKIKIQPYVREEDGLKQFTFDGEVEIDISVLEVDIKEITLHTKNLNISSVAVFSNNIVVEHLETKEDVLTNKFTIFLKENLTSGRIYQIRMSYKGQMDDDLHGFYRSSYTKPNGEKR